jgi:conjugal transfer/type IV secretion protein DotA/TraY
MKMDRVLFFILIFCAVAAQAAPLPDEVVAGMKSISDFKSHDAGHAILNFLTNGAADDSGGASLLSTISYVLNTIALCMMAWLAVLGGATFIIQTANKGTPGGQVISSFWAPIRIATATILLIPISSGYSSLQLGVYKIAEIGNSSGNAVLEKGLDYLFENGIYKPPAIADLGPVMAGWVASEVCLKYINASSHTSQIVAAFREEQNSDSVRSIYAYDQNPQGSETYARNDPKKAYCGAISITIPREAWVADNKSYDYATPTKIQQKFSAMLTALHPQVSAIADMLLSDQSDLIKMQYDGDAFQDAFKSASQSQPQKLPAAASAFNSLVSAANGQVVTIIATSVNEQATENAGESWKDEIKKTGWPALGTIFWQTQLSQKRINHLAEIMQASYESPHVDRQWDDERFAEIGTRLHGLQKQVLATPQSFDLENGILVAVPQAGTDGSLDFLKGSIASLSHAITKSLVLGGADADLLTSLQYSGSVMMASSEMLYFGSMFAAATAESLKEAAKTGAEGATQSASSIPIVGSLLGAGSAVAGTVVVGTATFAAEIIGKSADRIQSITTILILAGFTLAVVLPCIPLFFWFVGVTSWMLFYLECLLVSPFWLAAHGTAEKEGWGTEHTRQGYMLMIGLFLNPVLRVAGFFACLIALRPIGLLVQWLSEYIQGVLITGAISPFMIVGSCVLLAIFSYTLIVRVFSLPNELFERGLRWVNGGQEVTGDEKAESGTRAGAVVLNSRAEQMSGAARSKPSLPSAPTAATGGSIGTV